MNTWKFLMAHKNAQNRHNDSQEYQNSDQGLRMPKFCSVLNGHYEK